MDAVKIIDLKIKVNEVEGKKFYFMDLGNERNFQRVWINSFYFESELRGIMNEYKEVLGVFRNARVEKTQKGNIIIRKGDRNLFFIMVKCGYRGSSSIKVLGNDNDVIQFDYYHSPRGNLGISSGVVVSTKRDSIKIEWKRSGRLYGSPSKGTSIIHIDGRIESIDNLVPEELEEIEKI